ncbi:hypothetical protein Bbelb_159060 [Branchiostoma belcheri]|nr:hypothetical protein Bbelb_159060 [Branchiostoma belcheri]
MSLREGPHPALPISKPRSPLQKYVTTADSKNKVDTVYEDSDNNMHQYANKHDIDVELRQPGIQRKDPTNVETKNPLTPYRNDAVGCAGTCGFRNATSRRTCLPWVIAVMLAAVIGTGVGLVTFYTMTQETHPFSHNNPPVRRGTSSRPVQTVPVTPVGYALENNNETLSPYLTMAEDLTNSTALSAWKTANGVRTSVSLTDVPLETSTLPEAGTSDIFTPATTAKHFLVLPVTTRTTSHDLTTTIPPEVTTKPPEVTTTPPEVTTTPPEVTTTPPEVTTTPPEVTTTSPEVTTPPELTTTLPVVTTIQSEVPTTLPEPQPSMTQEGKRYYSLGCWKDGSFDNRAIPTLERTDSRFGDMYNYQTRSDAVEKCYQVAKSRSFTVFAVQHGGQCLGSADGHNTYYKFGRSFVCRADGKGGTWASEVYRITTQTVALNMRNGGCQDGYRRLGSTCIRLAPTQKSFWDASQSCVAEGATLAMPKTEELDRALRRLVKMSGGNAVHWIGMRETCTSCLEISKYHWVDGLPLGKYQGWHPGEPRNIKESWNSLCVQYWYSGQTPDPINNKRSDMNFSNESFVTNAFTPTPSPESLPAEPAFIVTVAVLAIVGNLLVIAVTTRRQTFPSSSRLFISSMAFSDLLDGLTFPFMVAPAAAGEWTYSGTVLRTTAVIGVSSPLITYSALAGMERLQFWVLAFKRGQTEGCLVPIKILGDGAAMTARDDGGGNGAGDGAGCLNLDRYYALMNGGEGMPRKKACIFLISAWSRLLQHIITLTYRTLTLSSRQ